MRSVSLYNSLQSRHVGRLWQTGDPILVELSLWPPSSLLQLFLLNLGHEKMPRHEATANIPRTAFIIWWLGTTHNLLYVVILYGKMGQISDINKYCLLKELNIPGSAWLNFNVTTRTHVMSNTYQLATFSKTYRKFNIFKNINMRSITLHFNLILISYNLPFFFAHLRPFSCILYYQNC